MSLILDETSFVKKNKQTACVQRAHCGVVRKTENCVVSVHLCHATPDFHALLDGELYLRSGSSVCGFSGATGRAFATL